MRVSVVSRKKGYVDLHLEDENVAVAELINHELLSDTKVTFAGAVTKHPLVKKVVISIRTKSVDPLEVLAASTKRGISNVESLLKTAKKALG